MLGVKEYINTTCYNSLHKNHATIEIDTKSTFQKFNLIFNKSSEKAINGKELLKLVSLWKNVYLSIVDGVCGSFEGLRVS